MKHYDPETAPDPTIWLALDEGIRIDLVERHHRAARIPLSKRARQAHACIHVVVENQLALDDDPVVRALARLMKEGLSRHDAVHAIGSCFAEHFHDVMTLNVTKEEAPTRYYAAVESIDVATWRRKGE